MFDLTQMTSSFNLLISYLDFPRFFFQKNTQVEKITCAVEIANKRMKHAITKDLRQKA